MAGRYKRNKPKDLEPKYSYSKKRQNKEYKVSVIIPTYNTGRRLNESIGSIIDQTIGFENIEVIIVDDKSTDRFTINLIYRYASKYPNCRVFFLDENSGFPGYPRNVGIDNASSDFVMVMDHDDFYAEDALEVMYNKITEENADLAICNYVNVYDDKIINAKPVFANDVSEVKIDNISENLDFFKISPSIWTRIFRKEFLINEEIYFIESMLAEDLFFNIATLLKANGIVYLNNYYGYNYRIRNSIDDKSTIHIRNKKYLYAMIEGYYETLYFIESENYEDYFSNIFKEHFVYWLTSFISSDIDDEDKRFLIEKINPLLIKQIEDGDGFDERIYKPLYDSILEANYNETVKVSNKIKKSRERKNKIKNFLGLINPF